MVARERFELSTLWLKVKCSTDWASEPKDGCLGWVRTSGMSESKSDALPLGYEAILKWWGDMDLNHGTRRNRFLYYYSFHYHFRVCSLDFLLTLSLLLDLGPSYKVSTLGINLARDCHIITYLDFPELATSTLIVSNEGCK